MVTMAKRGPTTFAKRQREREKQERRQAKQERRQLRKEEKSDRPSRADMEVDPDIAGIVPGPQPLPDDEKDIGNPPTSPEPQKDLTPSASEG